MSASAVRADFFAHQDQARRRTAWLVGLFLLSVALIVAAVYAVVMALFQVGAEWDGAQAAPGAAGLVEAQPVMLFNPALFALVSAAVLLIVGAGTLYKIIRLSGGGAAVAEMLGGRPVAPATTDPLERRLLNVVEEMAIASGVPPPRVYLLADEAGINAFAAGYSTRDAVVAVTRGACSLLTRDELQGVVAHEFSHILNGDMRLNLRLIGILHGLLVMSLVGYGLFRAMGYARPGGSRRGKGSSGALVLALLLLGLAVMVIGYIGVFFGNLIKAAVSRQREFLADASAVQFTRNPDGLAGALKKIAGLPAGSRLLSPHAAEASHLFFSGGVRHAFAGWLDTHPPLAERIRRLDPAFDGALPGISAQAVAAEVAAQAASAGRGDGLAAFAPPARTAGGAAHPVAARVGTLTPAGLADAAALLGALPADLREQVRHPGGAMAALYALLLSPDGRVRDRQLAALASILAPPEQAGVRRALEQLAPLGRHLRLPLAALAVQPLRQAGAVFRQTFRDNLAALANADQTLDLFEFALLRTVEKNLEPGNARRPAIRYTRKPDILGFCRVLFSALAHAGHDGRPDLAKAAFQAAMRSFAGQAGDQPLPPGDCGVPALDPALDALRHAAPSLKKAVLDAAAACVSADQNLSAEEGELLRVVADALDCPLPPLALAAQADAA